METENKKAKINKNHLPLCVGGLLNDTMETDRD